MLLILLNELCQPTIKKLKVGKDGTIYYSGPNWQQLYTVTLENFDELSKDGGQADFAKNLHFDKNLYNDTTFRQIHLAGQYLRGTCTSFPLTSSDK